MKTIKIMKNKESDIFIKWLVIVFKVTIFLTLLLLVVLKYSDSKIIKETAIFSIKGIAEFFSNFAILTLLIYLKEIKTKQDENI